MGRTVAEHRAGRRTRRTRLARLCSSVPIRAALSLGVLLGGGSLASYAYWSDEVTVAGTTFTAGSLDLVVNGDTDDSVTFTAMNIANMSPGASTAGVLTVANTGTVALKYTVATTASNTDGKNLAGALTLQVTGASTVTGTAPSATCAGTALPGTASALTANLVTSGRLLAAGATETLCVQAGLPATAAGTLQGAQTNVTFAFAATSDLS